MATRARLAPPREAKTQWPWHHVKTISLKASLLFSDARRMEAENFLATGYGTRVAIEAVSAGWGRLSEFAKVWQPNRLKGIVVSRDYGRPYLSATQIFDVRPLSRRYLSLDKIGDPSTLKVAAGQILVTRSGNVGRCALAHSVHENHIVSDDLLRVEARDDSWWGWIYASLRAPTMRGVMTAARYGHIIKHLETHHLDSVPILRVRSELRENFQGRVREVIAFRDQAHTLVNEAEANYLRAVGIPPDPGDGSSGFVARASAMFASGRRLEGQFHNPKARAAEEAVRSGGRRIEPLGKLVEQLFVPGRFKHVYGDDGIPYLDSAQILEVAPEIEKRVLSLRGEKQAGYLVDSGTLLLPCSGQTHGIIGSVVLATSWFEHKVLTNHILRIVPKAKSPIRIGYLQQVLSHPDLGRPRVLKGAFGSSVPELSVDDLRRLSVPRLTSSMENNIADSMEEAAKLRALADQIDEQLAEDAEDYVRRFLAGDRQHVESAN